MQIAACLFFVFITGWTCSSVFKHDPFIDFLIQLIRPPIFWGLMAYLLSLRLVKITIMSNLLILK